MWLIETTVEFPRKRANFVSIAAISPKRLAQQAIKTTTGRTSPNKSK
jgi:hypothetical protein